MAGWRHASLRNRQYGRGECQRSGAFLSQNDVTLIGVTFWSFTREFIPDHEILQREQKTASGGLWAIAYGVDLAITLSILSLLAWALHRLARSVEPPAPRSRGIVDRPREPVAGPQPVRG